ncbi:hypothetical protein BJV74DRAFT_764510 [Russula compacta]|nr:hypothetical protein BJV74DRAFT_764510 [Russula compacta]
MPTSITDDQLFNYAKRVKGKVVVITGAASGIGREAALTFARHGPKVVIGDLDAAGGEAVVNTIRREGGEAAFIKCDVTQWGEQVALFELAIARSGAVDIVIPNAGINESEDICWGNLKFVDGKPAKPELLTLKVNLTAVLYSEWFFSGNRAGEWKSLVLIGSMASWVGLFTARQYTAAKHGVLGLMRSLDPVVAGENIRTACIHPWFTGKHYTNVIDRKTRTIITGMPMTPVARVAGAIFRAATDPDPTTSGCPWMLPDHGPVLLLQKEELREGVYEILNDSVGRILR